MSSCRVKPVPGRRGREGESGGCTCGTNSMRCGRTWCGTHVVRTGAPVGNPLIPQDNSPLLSRMQMRFHLLTREGNMGGG